MTPKKEPAVFVSAIVGVLTAFIGLGAAFGLDVTEEQKNAIIGVVAPTSVLIALVGPIIRQFVRPVSTSVSKDDVVPVSSLPPRTITGDYQRSDQPLYIPKEQARE